MNSLEGRKHISTIAGVMVSLIQSGTSESKWRNRLQCVWGPQGSQWIPRLLDIVYMLREAP